MSKEIRPYPRQIEERVVALEIEVEMLKRQLADFRAAFMRMGQFIETVGKAAVEANKLPEE